VGTRFDKRRFYADKGPASLFERVHYIMDPVKEIRFTGHFLDRQHDRHIPQNIIDRCQNFDARKWKLVAAEVRIDKGKFVNSCWEIPVNGDIYWLVIGFGNAAETIISKKYSAFRRTEYTKEEYDFVEQVNRELMQENRDI
jgi:hypothetical protein